MAREESVRYNDVVVRLGTVNGTGSSSANGMLMKAIFRMGIPICGKNIFPSNIQGLPTWYEIRVSGDGYLGRSGIVDIMVGMNAQTYKQDINDVRKGGYFIYDSSWPLDEELFRSDIEFIGIPFAKMCTEHFDGSRVRILMKNIAYVGSLVALLDIDMEVIKQQLAEQFAARQDLMDSNMKAIKLGYDYAKEHFASPLPLRVRTMDKTKDYVMLEGNTATALGMVYGGATVGAWYPITPSTSVMDSFARFCKKFRTDPQTGEKKYMIIQAEDELAAAGMVLGANWNGARSFTPTSGPGISLMSEFIGFAYYAEIPAVFVDVQRVGPATGMPTRTQQGDLLLCAYASHGDTKHILLFPANPKECFELAVASLDLAERFQTPVFLLSDLDIGMNDWMIPRITWDDAYVPDRGKVLNRDDLERIKAFYRYMDTDGDGICARTLPGVHPKGAYFTRGSGHNKFGRYTELSDEYQEVMDRLTVKFETAKKFVPKPVVISRPGAKFGVLSIGGCDEAIREGLDLLAKDGIPADYMRVKAFPFGEEVEAFLEKYQRIVVIEQNRDAQLKKLLTLETRVAKEKLRSVIEYSGFPLTATQVVDGIKAQL
jgi:2-oxoglutarate ferredoxin oxidoreductase subunit alpha